MNNLYNDTTNALLNAIEHKSGVELPLKSGVEDIEVGEIVEEEVVKKKSGRARPIPKEEVEED